MPSDESAAGYIIWGADHATYGPVELPTLVSWIRDERVTADTWLFLERSECWEKASHVPELQMFFHGTRPTESEKAAARSADPDRAALAPGALRHIKLLAGLNDEQLSEFLQLMEVQTIAAGTQIAKQGEPAASMHILLEGEIRARTFLEGREASLGTLDAGVYFGEVSLFDHGPRCADFFTVQDSTLLKVAAADFEKFVCEKPGLAAPFLFALAKTFAARIRADNKRYRDSVNLLQPAAPR